MKKQEPGHSAAIIAAHRAIEPSKDENQRICYDPFARDFLPSGYTVVGQYNVPE